jgi:sporulation protein YlmC with PRC-barrel domain
MTQTTQFTIGAQARCSDGVCGEVTRVVVDPVAEALTHLVIDPKHSRQVGRLVPLDLVDNTQAADGTDGEIRLRCTLADFATLAEAEETHFLPGADGYHGYGGGQALMLPYYGLGGGMGMAAGGGMSMGMAAGMGGGNLDQPVSTDVVPAGEVSVHRGDPVLATDGEIGRVQGLVIAAANHQVTHVLLQEGHLFGRKEVTIPMSAVTGVTDGIQLTLTKEQVKDLPAVDMHLGA